MRIIFTFSIVTVAASYPDPATRDRARQSWTNDGEVVSVPREVVAENQTQVL